MPHHGGQGAPAPARDRFGRMFVPRGEVRVPAVALLAAGELFGGVERHVLDLAAALAGQGVQVGLALFHDAELAARARALGLAPRILPAARRAAVSSAAAFASWLQGEQIAIVHTHGYKAIVCAALARRRDAFDVVHTVHGLPEAAEGWGMRAQRTRLYARLDAWAARAVRARVCYVTDDLRHRLRAAHASLTTHVIPNGIAALDRHAFARPGAFDAPGRHFVVVGRLEPVKGQSIAIAALAHPRLARTDVQLHVLGEGPCAGSLERLAEACGVAARVRFHGFRRDVHAFIAHSDALLMPSLHEGLPYALLEAMALRTPVIASSVGGLSETLRHERTALMVAAGDVDSLAGAIERVCAQPELGAALAARAAAQCRRGHSIERMTTRYLDVYRHCADARGAPPEIAAQARS